MTYRPITDDPTSQPTEQVNERAQHHHDSTAQTSYQPRPTIKNRTAHPCITIRRVQEPGQNRRHELISKLDSVDLGQGGWAC
jgi:hypothetical protein